MMVDNRRHLRFKEVIDVRWTILGTDLQGVGKLLNISASGFLFQSDNQFDPKHSGLLFIDSLSPNEPLPFGSKKGKIIWLKCVRFGRGLGYVCGVEFLRDTPADKALSDWIAQKTEALSKTANTNILVNYIA